MLKSYEEMRKVDVRKHCKKRDGIDYLNWAKCIDLLRENGAETVYFEPCTGANGSSLIASDHTFTDKNGAVNRCYETKIKVVVDNNTYYMQTPVMNGSNPVKDNSMSQQRVWNSMCRAFVKCIAIHTGLGFDLWVQEENKQELSIRNHWKRQLHRQRSRLLKICAQVTELMEMHGLRAMGRPGKRLRRAKLLRCLPL